MVFAFVKKIIFMIFAWLGRLLGFIDDPSPTAMPIVIPMGIPTLSARPSMAPTTTPTTSPSAIPSAIPSTTPSAIPSAGPSSSPLPPVPDPLCTNAEGESVEAALTQGKSLYSNQDPRWICSPNKVYRMGLTDEGNLAIFKSGEEEVYWSAFSFHPEPVVLRMQADGNLVMREIDDLPSVVWTSSTFGNNSTLRVELRLNDDGLAQITPELDRSTVLWQSVNCGQWPARDNQITSDKDSDAVDATTLYGKVVTAYLGWHNTYCTGQWRGWSKQTPPGATTYEFEMWPEMDEYDSGSLCETDLSYADGSVASLYSSYDWRTVDTHVRWMSEYGIDGLIMQQFLGTSMCFRTTVLRNVMLAAEKYGRVFAVNLDVSGSKELEVYDRLIDTWKFLVDHEKITESPRYLHHKGRPLVGIWGFGFLNRPGNPSKVLEVLDWFQNAPEEKYRVTLMGGVPEGWQDRSRSSKRDEAWAEVYRSYNVINPWTVGRYRDVTEADGFRTEYTEPNVAELKSLGIDYLPVVFPGFSWSYRNFQDDGTTYDFNEIPRAGGDFLWRQMYNAVDTFRNQNVPAAIYVATMDEVDEATAIYKVSTSNASVPEGPRFVNLNEDGVELPSDWYLRLVGNAAAALGNGDALPEQRPVNP